MKKKILIMISLCAISIVMITYDPFKQLDIMSLKTMVRSFGPFAPLIFIILFTLVPLTLFPDAILAIAGGMIFGIYWGSLYIMIGALLGATLSFYISRTFGREFTEKLMHHKAEWFEEGVEKNGFLIVLLLRLIPLIPFDMISYGAGLSKIKYTDFIAASFIGIIPGVIIYANLGDKSVDVKSPEFIIAISMLIGLFTFSYLLKKKLTFKSIQNKIMKETHL